MVLSTGALTALAPRGDSRAATFALELRTGQDPRQTTAALLERLAGFDPTVTPISPSDHGVLVLELGTRTLEGAEPATAFTAGYSLAADFSLRTAEPDLATPFFVEEEPPPPAAAPVEETSRFPPGCWVEREEELSPRWALERINAPQAWQLSLELGRPAYGRDVVIAQPDTGVVPHEELAGVPRRGGYDVLDRDDDPTDPLDGAFPGHGTGTASVVVSRPAGELTGSAPAATHMPIRAVTTVIQTSQVAVAAALGRAVDDGAHVISLSLGGVPAAVLRRALRRAVAADVIVLAAAGNCVRTVVWPARYDECIAVGGTAVDDRMWKGSCRGSAVDIAAPAQNVYRAMVSGPAPIDQGQGTSFAVALTAGVAALWLAHHGRADLIGAARARGETLQQMFRRLVCASARRPADWDPFELGAGIVDARDLLAADLDLGRDRESLDPVDEASDGAASVAALVAETVGVDALPGQDFDWTRYGPELATVLLAGQLTRVAVEADDEAVDAAGPDVGLSDALARSIDNSYLRDHLRLDDDLPAEVVEVVGP